MSSKISKNGPLPPRKKPEKAGPIRGVGNSTRITAKKSKVRFNATKMDLNFTPRSPIICLPKYRRILRIKQEAESKRIDALLNKEERI